MKFLKCLTIRVVLVTTLVSILNLNLLSQEVFPGGNGTSGSYNLTMPNPSPICTDNIANCSFTLYNPVGGGSFSAVTKGATYRGPFQSHMWWNSALWNVQMPEGCPAIGNPPASYYHSLQFRNLHSSDMQPMPSLFITAEKKGYIIRNRLKALNGGGANNTGNFFADVDITFGYGSDTCAKTEVIDYGDFHAEFEQSIGINSAHSHAGNILRAKASQGSPFVFFTSIPSDSAIDLEPTFNIFYYYPVAISSSGNSVTLNRSCCPRGTNQDTWGYISLFFPPGTQLSNDGGFNYYPVSSFPLHVESGLNNSTWKIKFPSPRDVNFFTYAIMTDSSQSALDFYEDYAFNHIVQSNFSYTYDEPSARLTSSFNFTTTNVLGGANNGTLMTLFLHQYLFSPEFALSSTPYSYPSARGLMKVMTGNQFTTVLQNNGILPGLGWANTADSVTLNNFLTNYATRGPVNIDCGQPVYGSFGSIHEAARIALIANQAGNLGVRNRLLDIAKQGIERWLTSPSVEQAGVYHYDHNFNWLTPYPSAFDADRLLQDSHFHHGYLVFAAAIVAKFEPAGSDWVANWGPMINLVIRNINSELRPSNSPPGNNLPWIPYLRYYDPYVGHSWAGNDASNQESVSEAINFAAGVAMWGETIGNLSLRDMGLMMYITETESARMYWWDGQRRGVNNGGHCGYAPNYNHYHAAIVGSGGAAYATFFGGNVSYVHGITYLPITGASIWMGVDVLGASNNYSEFLAGNGGEPNGANGFWDVLLLMQKAVFNAESAKDQFISQAVPGDWSGADYKVDGYYWISTFDSVGVLEPSITANTASYAVFKKDSCKHYMIYNPRIRGARTVTFSDGQEFQVPADTIITYKVCPIPLSVSTYDFKGQRIGNTVKLRWSTGSHTFQNMEVEKSCDGVKFEKIDASILSEKVGSSDYFETVDVKLCQGKNYYRLKMVTHDLKVAYSQIIVVDMPLSIAIYPNPTFEKLTVNINSDYENAINLTLLDVLGKNTKTEFKELHKGFNSIDIDLKGLASGNYTLHVSSENETRSFFKVIKLD